MEKLSLHKKFEIFIDTQSGAYLFNNSWCLQIHNILFPHSLPLKFPII